MKDNSQGLIWDQGQVHYLGLLKPSSPRKSKLDHGSSYESWTLVQRMPGIEACESRNGIYRLENGMFAFPAAVGRERIGIGLGLAKPG